MMKTITALLIISSLVWGFGVVQSVTIEQDYNHCMKLYLDSVVTDSDISELIGYCELKTGYTQDEELYP
jgi:hypothetical protein